MILMNLLQFAERGLSSKPDWFLCSCMHWSGIHMKDLSYPEVGATPQDRYPNRQVIRVNNWMVEYGRATVHTYTTGHAQ